MNSSFRFFLTAIGLVQIFSLQTKFALRKTSQPSLPFHQAKLNALGSEKGPYFYNYTTAPPLAVTNKKGSFLNADFPRGGWIVKVANVALKTFLNSEISVFFDDVQSVSEQKLNIAKEFTIAGFLILFTQNPVITVILLWQLIQFYIKELYKFIVRTLPPIRPVNPDLSEYKENFDRVFVKLPEASEYVFNDEYFAHMRVAGWNPNILKKISEIPRKLNFTNAQFTNLSNFAKDDLNTALRQGRIYICDYDVLVGETSGVVPINSGNLSLNINKFVYAPIGLFGVPINSKILQPIAIQTGQSPTDTVATPNDPIWNTSKFLLNSADGNYHELISHLGRTHLLLEPFVAITGNMDKSHPIRNILWPHLEGTGLINKLAFNILIAPGQAVDTLLFGKIQDGVQISIRSVLEPGFNNLFLKPYLESRGLLTADLYYPYRDDAVELWEITEEWMLAYVEEFYPTDDAICEDAELQAWSTGLASQQGGRVSGFGNDGMTGKIVTKEYLANVLTMVAFTGGCQHAAVNFPQKGLMSYAPNAPLACYIPKKDISSNYLDILPPLFQALGQLKILNLLGSVYFTTYGNYDTYTGIFSFLQSGPKLRLSKTLQPKLKDFQRKLRQLEEKIKHRNSNLTELLKYEYLLPSKIPQSINI